MRIVSVKEGALSTIQTTLKPILKVLLTTIKVKPLN